MKILQGKFYWSGTKEEYESIAQNFVENINKTPGLHWKIWAFDDHKMEATGMYLYKDETSAVAAKKEIEENVEKNLYPPQLSNMRIRIWDVQDGLSKATRAPL